MLINESISDSIVVYLILKKLMKPFKEWEAYKHGIIDKDGKKLKKPLTSAEKKSWTMLDRFVARLKWVMQKFVGKSKMAAALTTAYLLKDSYSLMLGNQSKGILAEEQKPLVNWTHTKNYDFYSIVKDLPITEETRFYMIEGETDKFEMALYKYFKGVEQYLTDEHLMTIERLVKDDE